MLKLCQKNSYLEKSTNRACAEMAAERYSCEVLRMVYGPIEKKQSTVCIFSDAIRNLPPELRELILKEYISIKMKQREELGKGS